MQRFKLYVQAFLPTLNRFILVSLTLLSLSTTSAYAALINYDESVTGDLSTNPLFLLDTAGSNTWTGSFSWSNVPGSGSTFDADRWSMSLDPSLEITEYSVTFSNSASENIPKQSTYYARLRLLLLLEDTQTQVDQVDALTALSSTIFGPAVLPLQTPLILTVLTSASCFGCVSTVAWALSTDYEVSVVTRAISAVPVPAAVWLFGTALVGFVGMSRRRKVT